MTYQSNLRCIYCDRLIQGKYLISCTCGSFCNKECMDSFHNEEYDRIAKDNLKKHIKDSTKLKSGGKTK